MVLPLRGLGTIDATDRIEDENIGRVDPPFLEPFDDGSVRAVGCDQYHAPLLGNKVAEVLDQAG